MAWKGVPDAREVIIKGIHQIVCNGKDINFWTYNWAIPLPLVCLLSENQRSNINWQDTISDFIIDNHWNLEKLNAYLDHSIVRTITGISIPLSQYSDEFIWDPSASRIFFIKSATWIQCESPGNIDLTISLNKVWKLAQPSSQSSKIFLAPSEGKTKDQSKT